MKAPSQGGDLLAWVREQMDFSRVETATAGFASGEAFHRGVMECLREVLAGLVPLVAERDDLRARVAGLEAAQRWVPVTERSPKSGDVVQVASADEGWQMVARVVPHPYLWRHELVFFGAHQISHRGDPLASVTHWRPLPAGPEVGK